MPDAFSRVIAFLGVVMALLFAGLHFHQGHVIATLYFMTGAVLVTAVTRMNVRRGLI